VKSGHSPVRPVTNIIWAMNDVDRGGTPNDRYRQPVIIKAHGVQGFIDHEGNFLERQQAAQHARDCGQLTKPLIVPPNLFSEDLW
jgi:hypothetical protein